MYSEFVPDLVLVVNVWMALSASAARLQTDDTRGKGAPLMLDAGVQNVLFKHLFLFVIAITVREDRQKRSSPADDY